LQESEERFRILLDRIPGVAIQGFTADGTLHYWNQASEAIYGYRADQAIGRDVADLILPVESRDAFRTAIASVSHGGAGACGEFLPAGEQERRSGSGEQIWVHAVHTVVHLRDKPPLFFLLELDMRDKKRADEERVRIEKLESLGVLAGGIAHDFNNLLTVIVGNIGLAGLAAQLPPACQGKLMEAEKACLQAQALSKRLLTFAKGGQPVKRACNIAELLIDAATLVLSGSSARADYSLPPDLWPIEADPDQIHQVFSNLFINAAQAMPNGGVIRAAARNALGDPIGSPEEGSGRWVVVTIADEGVGIPDKYLAKVFDPYFTTKQKGSGLGLATAFSIVRNHQGRIEVTSDVGSGTVFTIHLPAGEKALSAGKAEEWHPSTGRGRILVLDDEPGVREVIGEMLGVLGYEAAYAEDGQQAIDLYLEAKAAGNEFAALIADLTIPGAMGGKEAVRRLLKIDPEIKAVVSSGYSNDPVMADFRGYGFAAALAKPVRIGQLSKILADLLE
jgi:PAS domain S-box-containing protein